MIWDALFAFTATCLAGKTTPLEHETNAFVCSMEVASFDATAAKILSTGGQIALLKFAMPGVCWLGYFIQKETRLGYSRQIPGRSKRVFFPVYSSIIDLVS